MQNRKWMILRNAYKTGTVFYTEDARDKALDDLVLRYRYDKFFVVEIENEKAEDTKEAGAGAKETAKGKEC